MSSDRERLLNALPTREILVLIPAFNEAENIGTVLDEARAKISALTHEFDVLVVDDGSSDETASVAEEKGAEVVRLPLNGGIGVALQTGFQFGIEFGYDYLVRIDADGQHPPGFIPDVLQPVLTGEADLAIGSRFIAGKGYRPSPMRRLGIAWFSFLLSAMFGKKISDPTSGFQAMNRKLMEMYSRRYASDYPEVEALVTALRRGYTVAEAPIVMKERQGGRSSIDWLQSIYYALKVTTVVLMSFLRKETKRETPA